MQSQLPFMFVQNERVFVRADLNVPLKNGIIEDDFRLKAAQPTLDLLLAEGARIVIGTHIGRPTGYDKHLSTTHLIPWFRDHSYTAFFASTLEEAYIYSQRLKPGELLIVENLRFSEHEKQPSYVFATQLARLADYYINDAFGLLHRNDTSITLLPQLYPKEKKTIGLLVEKELSVLEHLRTNARRPFLIFLGGGKVKDKLPLIEQILPFVDTVVVGPALSFTFLKAQGHSIGRSLVEDSLISTAHAIYKKAKELQVKLLLPHDYLIALNTIRGPVEIVPADAIPERGIGLTVGPKTLELYEKEVLQAGTIVLNGSMGIEEQPQSLESMYILLRTIAQSTAYSMIGGGESVAAVYHYGLELDISFCSSGGGSTLAYLSHRELPGLLAMDS